GDFTTAPEISQMFGELIGAWLAHVGQASNPASPTRIVELGPGRGTLMADILRTICAVPGFAGNLAINLVEMSPVLRERQQAALAPFDCSVTWHESIETIPPGPALFVANEFFDALPIYQYVAHAGRWHERIIGLDPSADAGNELIFTLGSPLPETNENRLFATIDSATPADGTIREACPAAEAILAAIAARIADQGGAALIIDYGYDHPARQEFGTLQAVRNHKFTEPLAAPGMADLTAHVDFTALGVVAQNAGAMAYGPISQGKFLNALGLNERAAVLKKGKDDAVAAHIDAAAGRLAGTAPDQMGTLFKAMAIVPADTPPPPPFAR
ncbi:MAG: class I SAM-dependent methyltransferase, partial [Alphaproteobacteria bacterium]